MQAKERREMIPGLDRRTMSEAVWERRKVRRWEREW